jgi:hypothetical protein
MLHQAGAMLAEQGRGTPYNLLVRWELNLKIKYHLMRRRNNLMQKSCNLSGSKKIKP